MFEESRRVWYFTTFDVGVERLDLLLGGVDLRHADAIGGVDDLALQVGDVDDVVVDDAQRPDARGGEVERGRRAQAAGAEQQHLGVEQLLLALGADLGEQEVARVALALLGREALGDVDGIAAVLPQRDAAGHRLDVLEAELLQRVRGERAALARGAVQDHVLRAVGDRGVDARLEIAARDVLGAGQVARVPLAALADVDEGDALARELADGGGIDLLDLRLDAAHVLAAGHAHGRFTLKSVGIHFKKYSEPNPAFKRPWAPPESDPAAPMGRRGRVSFGVLGGEPVSIRTCQEVSARGARADIGSAPHSP